MKTKKFKTLNGLFKSFNINTLSMYDILNGCLYDNKRNKHYNIILSSELKKICFNLFASAFCSNKTRAKYADLINDYFGTNYGIFRRVTIIKRNKKFIGDYCAGQDWIGETKTLQNILRKNR